MPGHTTFGDYIRAERDRADLGLREAARGLGISPSYLSRLEAGEFPPPSGPVIQKMAQLYGSDVRAMLDKAGSRQHEMMAADAGAAPALQQFYRLAHDQSPAMQEKMLVGAIAALNLSEEQQKKLIDQLRAALSRSNSGDLPRRASGDDGLFAPDIAPRFLSLAKIRDLGRSVLRKVFGDEIPVPVPIEKIIRRFDRNILLIVHEDLGGHRLRDGSPAVLGLSRWSCDGERRELLVHKEIFEAESTAGRRRASFTMAHEFAHCIEHLPLVQQRHPRTTYARKIASVTLAPNLLDRPVVGRSSGSRKLLTHEDWREWQANQLAAELLMPAEVVAAAFEELFGVERLVAQDGDVQDFADEVARTRIVDDLGNETSLVDRFDVNPKAMAIRLTSLGLVARE